MPKKLLEGDIVEIPTKWGLTYAMYVTHKEGWGELMWFYCNNLYEHRPADFSGVFIDVPDLVAFFPLKASLKRNLVVVVGHKELEDRQRIFPTFRAGDPDNGWLWDGEKEWFVGVLSDQQQLYPVRQIVNRAYIEDIISIKKDK